MTLNIGQGGIGTFAPNTRYSQPVTYIKITNPTALPVSLSEAKTQLSMSTEDTSYDDYLTLLINVAKEIFENYTSRTLITTQYLTYRTNLVESYELERSRLISLDQFQYLNTDNGWVDFDSSSYYVTDEDGYSRIIVNFTEFPRDKIDQFQSIQITFTAGYGTDESAIPYDIRLALLQHVAQLFANRGDCSCDVNSKAFPQTAGFIYNKYRISALYGGIMRGSF
jgi:uncharacterized phiE125 gp8 family phage protein